MVRRAPLSERLRAYLDMWDWILWISEEINGSDWEEFAEGSATTIGIALNVIFMIARSWSGEARPSARDDVFGDFEGRSGTGWLVWFVSRKVYAYTSIIPLIVRHPVFLNRLHAICAFFRKRRLHLHPNQIVQAVRASG